MLRVIGRNAERIEHFCDVLGVTRNTIRDGYVHRQHGPLTGSGLDAVISRFIAFLRVLDKSGLLDVGRIDDQLFVPAHPDDFRAQQMGGHPRRTVELDANRTGRNALKAAA